MLDLFEVISSNFSSTVAGKLLVYKQENEVSMVENNLFKHTGVTTFDKNDENCATMSKTVKLLYGMDKCIALLSVDNKMKKYLPLYQLTRPKSKEADVLVADDDINVIKVDDVIQVPNISAPWKRLKCDDGGYYHYLISRSQNVNWGISSEKMKTSSKI